MIDGVKKFVSNILESQNRQRRYMGLLSVCELEIGNFFNGDTAFVCGIPKVTKTRDDGTEYDEPGVANLRGGLSVVNGLFLIYDGVEVCWKLLGCEFVKPEERKKLSEIYNEIDFTAEVANA